MFWNQCRWGVLGVCLLLGSLKGWAQAAGQSSAPASGQSSASAIVPRLVRFAGLLKDAEGKPLSGNLSVTFAIYAEAEGGQPLWSETQNVGVGSDGHYQVLLGGATSTGLPDDLFSGSNAGSESSAQAEGRWLGIQVEQEAERTPRIMLVSVPYALKAADAEKLGGKSASDFVLREQLTPAGLAQSGQTSTGASSGPNSSTTKVRTASQQQAVIATGSTINSALSGVVMQFTYTLDDQYTDLPSSLSIPSIYANQSYNFTITQVYCEINGGSASINLKRNNSNILNSNLACSTSGASTTSFVSGTNTIFVGDKIGHVTVSGGSGLRRLNVVVKYSIL